VQKNGEEKKAVSNPTASKSCAKILPVNVYHKDNPENIVQMYAVIDDPEAKVSDSQQLNLLVKWLGVESTKQAESIRRSNADNPKECLKLLWNRLDTRYGSPEMVEALFSGIFRG
jgi:hypothetical protein